MMKINIMNETALLRAVIVGVADDFGGTPNLAQCYDPKSKEHVRNGTFPDEKDCVVSMDILVSVFEKYNIIVYRPKNIKGLNQIFSRDIAFVIENKLVLPNIIEDRKKELGAIDFVLNHIQRSDIITMPEGTRAEGGDVILCNDYIFVGYSEDEDFAKYITARTNKKGLSFLIANFPNKKVKGFELQKSDDNARNNALHLDCCFQPIGQNMAILYRGGFKNDKDVDFLINYFGKENIIEVSRDEMYRMNLNVFSISEDVIISEKGFVRLNTELRSRGFIIEEVPYAEIGKMSGLFRCSTMPLIRN
ncbi:MAG: arginine deiminase-related protein [Bacteroidota bacterium]|nr:arginine deiminase-related protein [Bacteroidota bacterium]